MSENETCRYCGGNCPNEPADSPHLCDGYAGDIDSLYKGEEQAAWPPPEATKLESFAIHVATLPNDSAAVCLQIPDQDNPPEFKTLMCGCEYLMSVVAQNSGAGFEAALDKLVEGAMTYQTYHKPEEAKKPQELRDFHFVVKREGESTFCIVRARTHPRIKNTGYLHNAIQIAVSDWINNTDEGKDAYEESCQDMNVGDLSRYLDDDYLQAALKERGVEYLKLVVQPGSPGDIHWTFDSYVFDAATIKALNGDED